MPTAHVLSEWYGYSMRRDWPARSHLQILFTFATFFPSPGPTMGGGDSASTTQADTWLPKKQIRTAADKVFVPPDSADISKMQMD